MYKNNFFKFLKYFGKNYEFQIIYTLCMAFMSSLLEFLGVVLVFPFIMILVNPGRVVNNPVSLFFHEKFGISGINNMILCIGGLIAGVIIIKNLYCIFIAYWQNKFISQWGLEIKEKLMRLFLYAPYETDLQKGNSVIIKQITKNVDDVMQYYVYKVISLISNTFVIVLVFSVLIYLLPLYTLLAIAFFLLTGFFQNEFFKRRGMKLGAKRYNLTNGQYTRVINGIHNVKDIKVTGSEKFFYNLYKNISERIIPYNEKINLIPLIPQYVMEIIFIFTMIILCLGILSKYGENPSHILINFGVVAIAIYRIVPQVYKNQVYLNYINMYKANVEELFKVYDEYKAYENYEKNDDNERLSFENSIVVKNLCYSYNKKNNVLQDINIEIKKGEFIGIVGLSGAGKSTFADCLLGLLDYEGDIFLDNTRLCADNIRKFRNIIGYVPQKIITSEGDIYTNVAWGVERKDIDKTKADDALKIAQLYDQLTQTENGLEIELKSDGSGLSGGQTQRIGIARALYRNPEIIILDEATANLDVKIENKLTDILAELKGNKTIIAIAHRLSTLLNSDRIAYIQDGKLIDIGTFKELSDKYPNFEEIIRLSKIKIDEENKE